MRKSCLIIADSRCQVPMFDGSIIPGSFHRARRCNGGIIDLRTRPTQW